MFGARGGGGFGTFGTSGTTFGTPGATGWYGGFGQPLQQGTGKPEWRSTREEIPLSELGRLGESPGMLMSISAMEEYSHKSHEELRVEDYHLKRRSSLAVGLLVPPHGTLAQQQRLGTGMPKWQATAQASDSGLITLLMSVSAMEEYKCKSYEELRVEDYLLNRRSSLALGILGPALRPALGPAPQQQQQHGPGTGTPKWQPTVQTSDSGPTSSLLMSISAMEGYEHKSYEELRVEDYRLKRTTSLAVGILCPTLGPPAGPPSMFGGLAMQGQGPAQLHAAGGINLGGVHHFGFNPVAAAFNPVAAAPATPTPDPPSAPVPATVAFGSSALAVEGLFGEAPQAISTGVKAGGAGFFFPSRRQQPTTGTGKWRATKHLLTDFGSEYDMIMSISGMKAYAGKSPEELRAEDYSLNRQNSTMAAAAAPTAFGAPDPAAFTTAAAAAARIAPAAGGLGSFGVAMAPNSATPARATAAGAPALVTHSSSGESRCLDAVTITLNQACEGGDGRWFGSTLELQLVSLGFCRASRSVPSLHVNVVDGAPRSLWSSEPVIHSSKCSWQLHISRVPTVCALSLSWEVGGPMIAKELWAWLEVLRLVGPYAVANVGKVVWPRRIKGLVLDAEVDAPLETITWPPSLEHIVVEGSFNKPIVGVTWPAHLETISFGDHFDQSIAGALWPATLHQLCFGYNFNQPIASILWPTSLKTLVFGACYDQPVAGVAWPPSMRQLSFGYWFDQSITGVVWPPSLQQLSFGCRFNQPIIDVVWPASMQSLTFGETFDQPLAGVAWPPCMRQLSFGYWFDQSITEVLWPPSLQQLSFGCRFNQPIVDVVWPASMQSLVFGGAFDQAVAGVSWPASLQQLSFGDGFNQSIAEATWPAALEQVSFGDYFDKPISAVVWPPSLRKLKFGCFFNRSIADVVWPASLQQLEFVGYFNQPIIGVTWPASLQELSFGVRFNQPIVGVVWPASLKSLTFGGAFNQPVDGSFWPASLGKLSFGDGFCHPMNEFTRQRLSSLMF